MVVCSISHLVDDLGFRVLPDDGITFISQLVLPKP